MLQQTTVTAVIPYFKKWIKRYPSVSILAKASEAEIVRFWEGLGYYSRARNILRSARLIVENGGDIPDDYGSLVALPGIGDYTASAILSIAWQKPYVAVDANVRRVLSRVFGGDLPRDLTYLLPAKRPGDFSEALMDLGASICLPREPQCGRCPIIQDCRARAEGREKEIPERRQRTITILETDLLLLVDKEDVSRACVLIRKREGNLLKGMWGFPSADEVPNFQIAAELEPVDHRYTRYREKLRPLVVIKRESIAGRWVPVKSLARYAFPSPYRKIIKNLEKWISGS